MKGFSEWSKVRFSIRIIRLKTQHLTLAAILILFYLQSAKVIENKLIEIDA